jgi:hypothetical protein
VKGGANTGQPFPSIKLPGEHLYKWAMRCQNVGVTHELEIFNIRQQQAARERTGFFHFDGECRECFAPYWQHGSSVAQEQWKLKPAGCDCGCA